TQLASFYAEPAVTHLELWRSPATTQGWWTSHPGLRSRCSAAEFLIMLCQDYGKLNLNKI
ncbi:MAG: hypothetical protein F6K24_47060, partial [Okeania sp. SIO2D1]|nr:hypothetical protein [Okeania sp. SIO2D1]